MPAFKFVISMQEASEAGVLGKPQFKVLSCGLALVGFAHIMALHPYWANNDCGPLMPYILGTWAAAAIIGAWGALLRDWRGPQTAAAAAGASRA